MRSKSVQGFQTGDMVKANVTSGKKVGVYVGRVAVRATGNFNITSKTETVQGISHKHCTLISRNDGYGYQLTNFKGGAIPPATSANGKLGYPGEV